MSSVLFPRAARFGRLIILTALLGGAGGVHAAEWADGEIRFRPAQPAAHDQNRMLVARHCRSANQQAS